MKTNKYPCYINITEECTQVYVLPECSMIIEVARNITNIKAKSKRYHWIQKIPVLKRLFIQNSCKRSRCLEENPVFLFLSKKKMKKKNILPKFASTCSLFDCRSFPI